MKKISSMLQVTLAMALLSSPLAYAQKDKAGYREKGSTASQITFTKAQFLNKDKQGSSNKGKTKSRSQAKREAEKRFPGSKVLKLQEVNRGGRLVYKIKLLEKSGRVRTISIDGNSR